MQEKWTLIEAQSQHCTRAVVGTFKHFHPADTLQHEWTLGDAQAGRCLAEEVGTSRLPPFAPLLPPEGYRPPTESDPTDDDLLSDLGLARRLYRKDPERFIASHASVANKLLDIQEKAQSSSGYPSLTDHNAWSVLLAKIGKEASTMDAVLLPPPALLLRILHEAGGSISAFKAALRPEKATENTSE